MKIRHIYFPAQKNARQFKIVFLSDHKKTDEQRGAGSVSVTTDSQ